MKKHLWNFTKTYLLLTIIFSLEKPLFMLYYYKLFKGITLTDYLDVIIHGLPLDLSMAGYLTIIPAIILIMSLWIVPNIISNIRKIYYSLIAFLISLVFICDLELYKYWGFRLDSTPFFYFFSSPKDALASTSIGIVILGILVLLILCWAIYYLFYKVLINEKRERKILKHRLATSGVLILLTGLLFIPIRGGLTVSTMNVSKAYYSNNMLLNHAAINPLFNLMASISHETDFGKQYRFMSPETANKEFDQLIEKPTTDSIPRLITKERPNVIIIVLESFMSKTMETLGGLPNVAVNMDKLGREGILFTHFYANSFRTDRGLVSILSGYPGQPTTSIMKYPQKAQSLPAIPKSLKEAGYNLQYYYGGDADFTNMRSYLFAMGINNIISDKDFPLSERLSKWGAHDHIVFNRMISDLKGEQKEPFMKILQTSSSHEPYDVPFHKLSHPYLNSVAYADSCLGNFIDQFKQTKWWDNSIVVLVPDHARRYPDDLSNFSVKRYKIPLIIIGGAIKAPMHIDTYASQIDIAATLLGQLNIPHKEFRFSKNILNPKSPHFGYFTFPNIFGMVTPDNTVIFNCESGKSITDTGSKPGKNLIKGKAFLQKLYDDLAKR
ncbi:sulfatase-like hydrolase/transferase [uncultured Bacteroides sp.]|uniref:LTA synthase family protein n=1 Tax=uncultured Bacteroides sp. TaxID=162156 RepID=UPI002AA8CA3D|nr:sulfatase-like hydrolase/transferase [uncultured Bacteroides sp.]